MFIELTNVYYNDNTRSYRTAKLIIKASKIVSVTDKEDRIGTYWCRRVTLDNGNIYYVKESYDFIVSKMNAITNLMYKDGEDNDWK